MKQLSAFLLVHKNYHPGQIRLHGNETSSLITPLYI
jgi:hypothetical protein